MRGLEAMAATLALARTRPKEVRFTAHGSVVLIQHSLSSNL